MRTGPSGATGRHARSKRDRRPDARVSARAVPAVTRYSIGAPSPTRPTAGAALQMHLPRALECTTSGIWLGGRGLEEEQKALARSGQSLALDGRRPLDSGVGGRARSLPFQKLVVSSEPAGLRIPLEHRGHGRPRVPAQPEAVSALPPSDSQALARARSASRAAAFVGLRSVQEPGRLDCVQVARAQDSRPRARNGLAHAARDVADTVAHPMARRDSSRHRARASCVDQEQWTPASEPGRCTRRGRVCRPASAARNRELVRFRSVNGPILVPV